MLKLSKYPSFIVKTELEKAAFDKGYRLSNFWLDNGWYQVTSTTAKGTVWLSGSSDNGPWLLALDHLGVIEELNRSYTPLNTEFTPGIAAYSFNSLSNLYAALDRVYELSVSLPDVPLSRFQAETSQLPNSTEAERLIVQRVGQDIFRQALLDYWGHRCPMTGITDKALLRASHIVPWSQCKSDAQRLDVFNGLLLSSLWDAAFDTGLISFTNLGEVLISRNLSEEAKKALGITNSTRLEGLRQPHITALTWHRKYFGFNS